MHNTHMTLRNIYGKFYQIAGIPGQWAYWTTDVLVQSANWTTEIPEQQAHQTTEVQGQRVHRTTDIPGHQAHRTENLPWHRFIGYIFPLQLVLLIRAYRICPLIYP